MRITSPSSSRQVVAISHLIGREEHGSRLDAWLLTHLPDALGCALGKPMVRRLIMAGAVTINGERVRVPALHVASGDRIQARVDRARIPPAPIERPWHIEPRDILYRDEWLLALNKPVGLPTVPTADPRRPSVVDAVRAFLTSHGTAASNNGRAATPYVGLHQRLDRDTSGVLLVVLRPEANARLAEQFATRRIEKVYLALTVRPHTLPAVQWSVNHPLGIDASDAAPATPRLANRGDDREAATAFRLRRTWRTALLVEARPATGRKHQVRVHLAGSGLPILGDTRYRGPREMAGHSVPRVMLHAANLSFVHPVTGAPLRIEAPVPNDWMDLIRILDRLSRGPRRRGPRRSRA